jgi:CRP-like cAMP-binding protein
VDEFMLAAKLLTKEKSILLVKEGQNSDELFFIAEGCARLFYTKDDKEITDGFFFENQFLSSNSSFFERIPSLHSIELLEPTTFLTISRDDILRIANKHKDFERLGRIIVTRLMLQFQKQIAAMRFETALCKYESLINQRSDITQRISLTYIASYLGITLETLSRIRNPKNRI